MQLNNGSHSIYDNLHLDKICILYSVVVYLAMLYFICILPSVFVFGALSCQATDV